MRNTARKNGLPKGDKKELSDLIESHINIFRTGFSAGPASNFKLMCIDLGPDVFPVKFCLLNHSEEQREFLKKFADDLVRTGISYPNPTSIRGLLHLWSSRNRDRPKSISLLTSTRSTHLLLGISTRCPTWNTRFISFPNNFIATLLTFLTLTGNWPLRNSF